MSRTFRILPIVAALAVALAACSTGASASPSTGKLEVSGAWARPSTGMDLAGAAYLTITNGTAKADALLSVKTPAAKTAELHETVAGDSGMMGMQPVDKIAVPAGATVKLEPGSYHIMLVDLTAPLTVGATIELTLQFEQAGPVVVKAEVRAS